eukprot:363826-Chlamydomonas_euryale.AAC.4
MLCVSAEYWWGGGRGGRKKEPFRSGPRARLWCGLLAWRGVRSEVSALPPPPTHALGAQAGSMGAGGACVLNEAAPPDPTRY